jgi:hypothetical protein
LGKMTIVSKMLTNPKGAPSSRRATQGLGRARDALAESDATVPPPVNI